MRRRILTISRIVGIGLLPAALAALAVLLEPAFTAWARGREAVLPLILLLLLASLLHPRLRHLLVITLCYGVSFLAIRDTFTKQTALPPGWTDYDFLDQARPAALLLVALLAGGAALAETVQPGTVWARRCYFGAAALYFSGLGVLTYASSHSWQSVLLCVTGVIALFGCFYAPQIIASEQEAERELEVNDMLAQEERNAEHQRTLRAKEWREPSMTGAEETDTSITLPAPTTLAP